MKKKSVLCLLLVSLICVCALSVWAIPKGLKAKSEYILAKDKYEHKDYVAAIEHLIEARDLLEETTSDIQYLLVKSYWNTAQYRKAQKELEIYFDITSENSADKERFNEMVVLISRVEEKVSGAGKAAAPEKSNTSKKKAAVSPRQKRIRTARDKAYGSKRIPFEIAQKEGVPSPPYNTVVGKTYTYRAISNNNGIRGDFLRINRIVDRDPDQPVFRLEQTSVDQTKNPPEKFPMKKVTIREDGTCNSSMAAFFFKDFQCSGDAWPQGRLKAGDTWTSETSFGDYKSQTTYRVEGFKNINGHDCINVHKTVLGIRDGKSPSRTTVDLCWDYNKGVLVTETMNMKDYITKTELISVEFPEE